MPGRNRLGPFCTQGPSFAADLAAAALASVVGRIAVVALVGKSVVSVGSIVDCLVAASLDVQTYIADLCNGPVCNTDKFFFPSETVHDTS